MMAVCPCCLREYSDKPDPRAVVSHIKVGGVRRRILDALVASFGRRVNTTDVVAYVYGYRRDGGPMSARDCVKVHAYALRRLLSRYGLTIVGQRVDGGSFMLTWVAPAARERDAAARARHVR